MRIYDPEVYDAMQRIAFRKDKTIQMVERDAILQGFRFYNTVMDFSSLHWRERAEKRKKWHDGAMETLRDSELIFADPDNSLSIKQRPTNKSAQKFILPSEIMNYYQSDKQVMYYNHRSRKNTEGWLEEKRQIQPFLPDAKLLALSFHRWNARTYIFVIHEDKYAFYSHVLKEFIRSKWGVYRIDGKVPFTMESI